MHIDDIKSGIATSHLEDTDVHSCQAIRIGVKFGIGHSYSFLLAKPI